MKAKSISLSPSRLACNPSAIPDCVLLKRLVDVFRKVNYRKFRIGAGNRVTAEVTLWTSCALERTTHGSSIQLGHILLVPLQHPHAGRLAASWSSNRLDRLQ